MEGTLPLDELLDSWLLALRAERKSPHTLSGYRAAIKAYLNYCAAQGVPADLTKANIVAFMADATCQTSTARLYLTVLKLFARWLAAEEGFDADAILLIKHPKTDEKTVSNLAADEVNRLIKACNGDKLKDKRDKAMLALLVDTGLRGGELLSLDVGDVDVVSCTLHVVRGKGGKGRRVKFSATSASLIDRYRRARKQAGYPANEGALFVTDRGRGRLTYPGLRHALGMRAIDANVEGFHVHRLRHSSAVNWLKSGGSETGLMAQHGWKSRTMIDRYVKSASEELAAEEFIRLGLGLREA